MAEWVTCVPSFSHPGQVEAFAERLATLLGLPFAPCLTTEGGEPQARMQNSAQQASNARRSWACGHRPFDPARSCSSTTWWTPAGR